MKTIAIVGETEPSTVAPVNRFGIVEAALNDPAATSVLFALFVILIGGVWAQRHSGSNWKTIWWLPAFFVICAFLHLRYVPTLYLEPDAGYPAWGLVILSAAVVVLHPFLLWRHIRRTQNF